MSMRTGNSRRHARVSYAGPVRLAWDEGGEPRYAQARCLDLSAGGLRVEAPVAIPAQSRIFLKVDELKLSGSAQLKSVTRRGSKYILGLELNQTLHEKTLAAISQSPASQTHAEIV